jgi:DNA-binding MarR family transcriptional regulator
LELLPLMGGSLITSILAGQLISRWGRYKVFPVIGSGLATAGLLLLSRVEADTGREVVYLSLLIVGLGLGMVLQVVVLAVQNAVPYDDLGAATSTVTLFRFVGGSLGTAFLGAIFVHQLGDSVEVGSLQHAARSLDLGAFTRALDVLFLVAAGVTAIGFGFSLALPERPLREAVAAGARVDQALGAPTDDDPLNQISRCLWALLGREHKRRLLERIAARAGVALSPAATWLLARLGETPGAEPGDLARRHSLEPELVVGALVELRTKGLVTGSRELTPVGLQVLERLVAARRAALAELLQDWSPERHRDLSDFLRRVARDLAAESPA